MKKTCDICDEDLYSFEVGDNREELQHKAAHIINELTKYAFGTHLITCENCGCIQSTYPKRYKECPSCKLVVNTTSAPDLFY